MRAHAPQTRVDDRHLVVRTVLEAADGTELAPVEARISIEHADLFDPTATPGAAALVLAAAFRGEDLVIEGPVDERTATGLTEMAGLIGEGWGVRVPRVEVGSTYVAPAGGDGVALLFDRGVASWSALLDRLDLDGPDRVTQLVTVLSDPSAPLGAADTAEGADAMAALGRVAADLGLAAVVVETNVRAHLDPYRPWSDTSSAVLVGGALRLGNGLRQIVLPLPVGQEADEATRSGSDSATAFGTSRTAVVPGDTDRSYHQRVARLTADRSARSNLRVCAESRSGQNCGRCSECQLTMASLLLAGDTDPNDGFAHHPDPTIVAGLDLRAETGGRVSGLIAALPPEHEDLRRAWSDSWDRTAGVEPGPRWGDHSPPGLAGPGVAQRVAEALRATTGQANAPVPAPLGWSGDAVALRPRFDRHHEIRTVAATNAERPHAWAVIEHHIRDDRRDGRQARLAQRLIESFGSGPCYLPGILWDHLAPPVLGPEAVQRLLRSARARLWWRDEGDLEPLRVLEAVENGCLPLQVMPTGPALALAASLPEALVPLVIDEAELADLDLSPAAVAERLAPAVDHVLNGSAEHGLLAGAYR